MVDELAPGVLKGSIPSQVEGQALEGLVGLPPLGDLLVEGVQGQQLVGSQACYEPGLLEGGDAPDAGVHHLGGALGDAGNDRQHRVGGVAPQRGTPGPLHTVHTGR